MEKQTRPLYQNPDARQWRASPLVDDVRAFHETLPGYAPTKLLELPELAAELGIGRLFIKDESERLGLPAFKALGALYAVSKTLAARWGLGESTPSLDQLREHAKADPNLRLYAATDGNHGRAVARAGALIGVPATVYFPSVISEAAKQAIRDEGAEAIEVQAHYDEAVTTMAQHAAAAGEDAVVIQDTAWDGYAAVPQWIVEGYDTLFREIDEQLLQAGITDLELIALPAGVGSLAQAAVQHYRSTPLRPSTLLVEPVAAPALMESLQRGQLCSVPTDFTIMRGMNCGTPSPLAWPVLKAGVDSAILITEEETRDAVRDLREKNVDAGPCGAAGLAAVRAYRDRVKLDECAVVVLLNTESRKANPIKL